MAVGGCSGFVANAQQVWPSASEDLICIATAAQWLYEYCSGFLKKRDSCGAKQSLHF
jgi:hypothetical protein